MRHDGGPAFPCMKPNMTWEENDLNRPFKMVAHDGLSLRDYFAAKAMQAYIFPEMLHGANTEEEIANEYRNIAAFAYRMADAMLLERSK